MVSQLVKVACLKDVPEGHAKVVQANGHELALCNVGGEIYCIDDLCTHDNGPLGEGELVNGQIECPRHGARFDVKTGKALCLPAVLPVSTYKVEVKGDDIYVGLPE